MLDLSCSQPTATVYPYRTAPEDTVQARYLSFQAIYQWGGGMPTSMTIHSQYVQAALDQYSRSYINYIDLESHPEADPESDPEI